jgi:hypothetical protein
LPGPALMGVRERSQSRLALRFRAARATRCSSPRTEPWWLSLSRAQSIFDHRYLRQWHADDGGAWWVAGWLDNARLLVQQWSSDDASGHGPVEPFYQDTDIYSSSGTNLGSAPIPQLQTLQVLTSDSIYWRPANAILSVTTGAAIWESGNALCVPIDTNCDPISAGAASGTQVMRATWCWHSRIHNRRRRVSSRHAAPGYAPLHPLVLNPAPGNRDRHSRIIRASSRD